MPTLSRSPLDWFETLVPIHNPSKGEVALRQFVSNALQAMGITQQTVDAAGNLFVHIDGSTPQATYLLSAHMDSVPPCEGIVPVRDTLDGRPVVRSEGKTILGADDKAGIATILALAEALTQQPEATRPTIELMLSVEEEIGLLGAKAFDLSQVTAPFALILDGDGDVGDIFRAGPTQYNLQFAFEGVRAHAGIAPERGTNAIAMAAHVLSQVPCGRVSHETTLNFGLITGGEANNVVAPSAQVQGEARSHDEAALLELLESIKATCQSVQTQFPQGQISFTPAHRYSRFHLADDHPLVQTAQKAAQAVGIAPKLARMNIGSDAHIFNAHGLPSVVLGMGFHRSHSFGEYLEADALDAVFNWVWAVLCGKNLERHPNLGA